MYVSHIMVDIREKENFKLWYGLQNQLKKQELCKLFNQVFPSTAPMIQYHVSKVMKT